MKHYLPHVKGAVVKFDGSIFFVEEDIKDTGKARIFANGTNRLVDSQNLSCGLWIGAPVRHMPKSSVVSSLGCGRVQALRSFAGSSQVLVEFQETGERVWLPYERLTYFDDAKSRFEKGEFRPQLKRLKLRCLAYALELWNENTGALSNFEIDPLPHQIHLVYHILNSPSLNWLVADDVGLGKTIEVGLLLSALRQRKKLRSVLLVVPAGLTKQWQEEMKDRFRITEFRTYGEQFSVQSVEDWRRFPYVIASMDKLKQHNDLSNIELSEGWDLVVFDEGHRLTRTEYGNKFQSSERYKLACRLRKKTGKMLLLTATPHQGKTDKFIALLELLHPEWKTKFRWLNDDPEILKHCVIRNDKRDVTDANGEFIFQGKDVETIRIGGSKFSEFFDEKLRAYLEKGYSESYKRGKEGNAIGFVMTIYRKLASSSSAAILKALGRRLKRLEGEDEVKNENIDYRFESENDEYFTSVKNEFFEGERNDLLELIKIAEQMKREDNKMNTFIQEIIPRLLAKNKTKKILIFSEYITTQEYIRESLIKKYGECSCAIINGSMDYHHREREIARFHDDCMFMISTEAGGEGINLQKACYMMVNYDLPWNPSRLLQRVGRLYRYGQKEKVFVFNLSCESSFDGKLVRILYDRIEQVVKDMSPISSEFTRDNFDDEVLGSFIEAKELNKIFESALALGIDRSKDRIEDALRRAREAAEKEKDLFQYAKAYDPDEMRQDICLDVVHLKHFVLSMFEILGIKVLLKKRQGQVFQIEFPEDVLEQLPFRRRIEVTFSREIARGRGSITMLDLDSLLVKFLLKQAKSTKWGGYTAGIGGHNSPIMASVLRWQDAQGRRMRQEFMFGEFVDGRVELNSPGVREFLTSEQSSVEKHISRSDAQNALKSFWDAFTQKLASQSNENSFPESVQWIAGAW